MAFDDIHWKKPNNDNFETNLYSDTAESTK